MLVHGLCDPLSVGIVADGRVVRIDENHFEEFVRRILADPIRVENAKRRAAAANSLLKARIRSFFFLNLQKTNKPQQSIADCAQI